jgi:hypothetical protein
VSSGQQDPGSAGQDQPAADMPTTCPVCGEPLQFGESGKGAEEPATVAFCPRGHDVTGAGT